MELRVLRYFLAVVREESITAAAETLHITQPTLSRQLMELEEELGAQLLIRGGRSQKIALTEKGMLLRRRAEELVELADKTRLELDSGDEEITGDITIGGGETDAMRLIARIAVELRRQYPAIRYHLYSGNAEDVSERMEKGLVDFGVFVEPAEIGKFECLRLPAADTWGLLVRRDHPLAARKTVRPADLRGLPLLFSRQRLVSKSFADWYGGDAAELDLAATYNLVFNASLMVDEGFGCAVVLDKLVNTAGRSSLRFIPFEPKAESSLTIAWKKYQVFSRASQVFLQRVRAMCSQDSPA